MNKLSYLAVVFAIAGVVGADAQGAELEGALQYPPSSIGKDAQPPAPAGMVRQPMSPRRIELGVSGSSMAPGIQRFYIVPSARFGEPAELTLQSGNGGG
jgi:hypothetical protein